MVTLTMSESTELDRRVYCLTGVAPEVQAYAMARYSRSRQSMLESVRELNAQRAEEFLNTFYFQYGHRSIADLAHLAVAVENVSILAAVRVVDEQLWDGQERSTRYQDFRRTRFVVPPDIRGSALEAPFVAAGDALFTQYESLSGELLALLLETVPAPADMDTGQVERTLRARAFDVARYLLPLATRTSVGQVVSARVLERQISRLLSDTLPEVRAIGQDLRAAAEGPSATLDGPDLGPPTAPTLVKYTAPLPYLKETRRLLAQAAQELLGSLQADSSRMVELAPESSLLDDLVATLLYQHDPGGRSFRQVLGVVLDLSEPRKRELVELSVQHRGLHDELLRSHQAGQPLRFDILMDFGSYRDLHRHRRCIQISQGSRMGHGVDDAEHVFTLGLGEVGAMASSLQRRYAGAIQDALAAAEGLRAQAASVPDVAPESGDYLYPLAVRTRTLFKMDLAEAAYIIEQRTAPAGHFSYRHVAWEMYRELVQREPVLAACIRATNPNDIVDLFKR